MKRGITILGIILSFSLALPAVSLAACGAGDGQSGPSGDGGAGFNSLGSGDTGVTGQQGFGGQSDQTAPDRGSAKK